MNKEEILSQLTEISKRLDSEVDSFDIDARVEKIQANDAQADSNDIRIKYLTEQLANDNNYIDTTPIQYYNMQLAQANEELRAAQTAVDCCCCNLSIHPYCQTYIGILILYARCSHYRPLSRIHRS